MNQVEQHTWEPLKKSHPLFNSLVLKIVVSFGISIYSLGALSDYSFSYLYGDDRVLLVSSALLMTLLFLVLLSIVEALVMTAVSMVQWFIRKFSLVRNSNVDGPSDTVK